MRKSGLISERLVIFDRLFELCNISMFVREKSIPRLSREVSRIVYLWPAKVIPYIVSKLNKNVKKTQHGRFVVRSAIDRYVFYLFGNPTNLSRPSRRNLSACAIDLRARNSFSIVGEGRLYDPIYRTKILPGRTNERREYILRFLSCDSSSFRECENWLSWELCARAGASLTTHTKTYATFAYTYARSNSNEISH